MSFSRLRSAARALLCALFLVLPAACGDDSETAGKASTQPTKGKSPPGPLLRDGHLYLVVDFERREFDLLQGSVPLWTLHFTTSDTDDVADWLEAFQEDSPTEATPLSENILLRSRSLLSDSVIAIVAEASGFDAALLQRQIPARFLLRWDDAAIEVKTSVQSAGTSLGEIWQDARSTARRLFGEEQIKVQVDSIGALTLQRAAVPPIPTIVRPPRKR